jgi:hypothetical protein
MVSVLPDGVIGGAPPSWTGTGRKAQNKHDKRRERNHVFTVFHKFSFFNIKTEMSDIQPVAFTVIGAFKRKHLVSAIILAKIVPSLPKILYF